MKSSIEKMYLFSPFRYRSLNFFRLFSLFVAKNDLKREKSETRCQKLNKFALFEKNVMFLMKKKKYIYIYIYTCLECWKFATQNLDGKRSLVMMFFIFNNRLVSKTFSFLRQCGTIFEWLEIKLKIKSLIEKTLQ